MSPIVPLFMATLYLMSALVRVRVPSLPSKTSLPHPGVEVTMAGTSIFPSSTSDENSIPRSVCHSARMVIPSHSPVWAMFSRYIPRFLL